MGLFDKIKGEFIDVIDWTDSSADAIVYKFPRYQNEIKMGAQLTVRESQVALFFNEGKIADHFQPGMYTLETKNLPVLSTLKGWKYGFNSPFKADVYFVNTKQFTNQKWGTKNPVMLRDPEFGAIRVRAFGNFAFKVINAPVFIKEISGTDPDFKVEEVNEQLRNLAITRGMDAIAESKIPVIDLTSNYDELSKLITEKIRPDFLDLGLEITKFLVENISLPPEVEAALDKRSSMGIIGNLGAFTQFQAANSMEAAAKNPSGGGMMGAALGAGMGMGMMNQMGNAFQPNSVNPQTGMSQPPPPPNTQYFLFDNGQQTGPFFSQQLQSMIGSRQFHQNMHVWRQGMAGWAQASTLPELQALFAGMPPPPPPIESK